ncbi:MAG: hypothetical protein HC898_08920 [Phycisphaerales bacterium]|nr:hypothetical protein [Phycisphaerales bacterium]
MSFTRKSAQSSRTTWNGKHRFEHWYRDNQVYFITARCRDRRACFSTVAACNIFWDRLLHYSDQYQFDLWIVTLMNNHYHLIGYCRQGPNLGPMMQRVHGSVAKLVNDELIPRHVPFWREGRGNQYFDGCLRDEKQLRLAYRYTRLQAVKAGLVPEPEMYAHTRMWLTEDQAVELALARQALLQGVPYKRYQKPHE